MRSAPGVAPVWQAPAAWRAIDFISDLHLCGQTPATFAAFASYLQRTQADAVCILGDLFEAWVGDDALNLEFEQRCAQAMAAAAPKRGLYFMVGNRDFLAGSGLLQASLAQPLGDPTCLHAFGRKVLLSHGDALCLGDVDYQVFRRQVRSPAWQQSFLRLPLSERCVLAQQMRQASRAHQHQLPAAQAFFDVDADAAAQWLGASDASDLVHGHTHRRGVHAVGAGLTRHVLSDWDLEGFAPRSEVLRLDARGLHRLAPQAA